MMLILILIGVVLADDYRRDLSYTHYVNEQFEGDRGTFARELNYLGDYKQFELPFNSDEKTRTVGAQADYSKLNKDEVDAEKAFSELNYEINTDWAKKELKPKMKGILNMLVKDPSKNIKNRIFASKLIAKMTDVPVVLQNPHEPQNKEFADISTHIVLPSSQRMYQRDLYIEKMKAGNWRPDVY